MSDTAPPPPSELQSPLQRAPAWLKLGLSLCLGALLLGLSHPLAPALTSLLWLVLQLLARQNPWDTVRSSWPGLPLAAALGIIHCLGGDLASGILLAWRLLLLVWVTSVLARCTPSGDTIRLLESLLRPLPLRWLGLSSRDLALMLIISIRFLPLLREELHGLLKAQRARAFSARRLSWKARVNHLVLLGQVLTDGSFRRADQVSRALRARAYRPGSLSESSGSEAK